MTKDQQVTGTDPKISPASAADSQRPTSLETPEETDYFDIAGSAAYMQRRGLGDVTKHFIRSIISRGEIPSVRAGKKIYVSRAALDRWLEVRERRAR